MAAINTGKVIVGGLLAGLVINVVETIMNMFVLMDAGRAMYDRLGIVEPGGAAIGGFMVLGFVLGMLIAWVYAAIRPRFGPGPQTAVTAGLAVWVGAALVPIAGWTIMGVFTTGYAVIGLVYGLVEFVLAGIVAGRVYREETHAPPM